MKIGQTITPEMAEAATDFVETLGGHRSWPAAGDLDCDGIDALCRMFLTFSAPDAAQGWLTDHREDYVACDGHADLADQLARLLKPAA